MKRVRVNFLILQIVIISMLTSCMDENKKNIEINIYRSLKNSLAVNPTLEFHPTHFPNDPTPKFLVTGVNFKDVVKLYNDSNCQNPLGYAIGVQDSRTPISLESSYLAPGTYQFYLQVFRTETKKSSCIDSNLTYTIGQSFYSALNFDSSVNTSLVTRNGEILIGGNFQKIQSQSQPRHFLFAVDSAFNLNNQFQMGLLENSRIVKVKAHSDGTIYVLASWSPVYLSGSMLSNLVRLLPDGTLDTSFTLSNSQHFLDFDLQSDGRVVALNANGDRIVRLTSTGALDGTFDTNVGAGIEQSLGVPTSAIKILVDPDDKIVILGGAFRFVAGTARNGIASLNSDGTLDNSFTPGVGFPAGTSDSPQIIRQSTGKYIIASSKSTYSGNSLSGKIFRINSNGTFDGTFNPGTGFERIQYNLRMAINPDDSLVLTGNFDSYNGNTVNNIVKISANGSYDGTFNIGTGFFHEVTFLKRLQSGKFLITGDFKSFNGQAVNRSVILNSDGSMDSSPTANMTLNDKIIWADEIPSGGLIFGGWFTHVTESTETSAPRMTRLTREGSVDDTFLIGEGFNQSVLALAEDAEGRYLVGGGFTQFRGTNQHGLIRLKTSGERDSTFDIGEGFDSWVQKIIIQPDGKILVFGNFTTYKGLSTGGGLIRLLADGSRDGTFTLQAFNTANPYLTDVYLQPDGKILLAGQFTTYNGVSSVGLVRLESTGAHDATFVIGTGFNSATATDYPNAVVSDSNGRIYACGSFNTFKGVAGRSSLLRLLSDGTYDATYSPNNLYRCRNHRNFILEPDGKVIIGGTFTNGFGGSLKNQMVRLSSDGTLDTTFDSGSGQRGLEGIYTITKLPDESYFVGGGFHTFQNYITGNATILHSDGTMAMDHVSY